MKDMAITAGYFIIPRKKRELHFPSQLQTLSFSLVEIPHSSVSSASAV